MGVINEVGINITRTEKSLYDVFVVMVTPSYILIVRLVAVLSLE